MGRDDCVHGIPVKRDTVVTAARNALKRVRRWRAREFKCLVREKRRRLWGLLPDRTLPEAIRHLKATDPCVRWLGVGEWMLTGGKVETTAERLLKAAEVASGDILWLTTEEAAFVQDYLDS